MKTGIVFLLTGGLLAAANGRAFADSSAVADTNAVVQPSLAEKLAPPYSGRIGDVVKLEHSGVDESVVLTYIKTSAGPFQPTANDIVKLRQAGVSSPVIKALLERGQELRNQPEPATSATSANDSVVQNSDSTYSSQPMPNYGAPAASSSSSTVVYVQNYPETTTYPVAYPTRSGICQPYYYYHPVGYVSYSPYYIPDQVYGGHPVRYSANYPFSSASVSQDGNVVYIGSRYAVKSHGGWYY